MKYFNLVGKCFLKYFKGIKPIRGKEQGKFVCLQESNKEILVLLVKKMLRGCLLYPSERLSSFLNDSTLDWLKQHLIHCSYKCELLLHRCIHYNITNDWSWPWNYVFQLKQDFLNLICRKLGDNVLKSCQNFMNHPVFKYFLQKKNYKAKCVVMSFQS